MMKKYLATILFIFLSFFVYSLLQAKQNSYLYIQGDKVTPFYVKVNGKMVDRYGKNHCIVPQLNAGNISVEILFQQNIFAPIHYEISIPENGHKGFLLTKQADKYQLYDLENKKYLSSTE